jgi:stage V sporulation protein B
LPAVVIAAITLGLAAVGNYVAIPIAAERGDVLLVAALVTSGAMAIGALASGWALRRQLGAFLPVVSVVRVAIATVAAIAVGRERLAERAIGAVLPIHGKPMTLIEAVVVGVVFLAVLVITRELGRRDLEAIKAVRRSRASNETQAT